MKIVQLRFNDGSEKRVNASDPNLQCVRTSDGLVAGDLCRYSVDGRLVVAEVLDVTEIDMIDGTASSDVTRQEFNDQLAKIRADIKNELATEFQKLSSVFQTHFASNVRSECREVASSVQRCPTPEILDNTPEPAPNKHRRQSTPPISVNSEESYQPVENIFRLQSVGRCAIDPPGNIFKHARLTGVFPRDAILRVKTLNGIYVPVNTMHYDDLDKTFGAKWINAELPPIAAKLNMQLAVHHLRKPCLDAFYKSHARSFMYPIACYLFDMDVLLAAFLPHKPGVFRNPHNLPKNNKLRCLNSEAQDAFYFLVDYFSTILVNPDDEGHALWHAVVRNNFIQCVGDSHRIRRDCNFFLRHVIPGRVAKRGFPWESHGKYPGNYPGIPIYHGKIPHGILKMHDPA